MYCFIVFFAEQFMIFFNLNLLKIKLNLFFHYKNLIQIFNFIFEYILFF